MAFQSVVHRQSGTVHRSPVGDDLSVTKTLCGRVLDDMWFPVADSDTTCEACARSIRHRSLIEQGVHLSEMRVRREASDRGAGQEVSESDSAPLVRHFSPRPEADWKDDADAVIGYALLETEHLPGFARRGPAFREKLAEAGWEIRKVTA